MHRFLLALLIAVSIYGAYDYGRSQGSMVIRFDRPPRYPSVTPVINECKDSVTFDGYQRVAPKVIRQKECKAWTYQYDGSGHLQDALCMDDLRYYTYPR